MSARDQNNSRLAAAPITRRRFLVSTGKTALGLSALTLLPFAVGKAQTNDPSSGNAKKKISLIATEVRKYSHAQHFVDRCLEGYGWEGRYHHPPLTLAGLYVDQFPDGDLARERSQRHGVKIYPTIAEALTLGGSKLAVDGVLIIGEHGRYPRNEKGQTCYPRYRFFKEVVKVFEESHRSVPVFNDKHLSINWSECREMVADSKRLRFPFLAGSSLPVTWRIPSLDMPLRTRLAESVCVGYGGVDSYDFHGLETAQCMSERRAGGETGVKSVHAVRRARVCEWLADDEATRRMVFAALSRSHTCKPKPGYTQSVPNLAWLKDNSAGFYAYRFEHRDGLKTTLFMLNGLVQDFTYAGRVRGTDRTISCQMYLPMPPASTTLADFFNPLFHHVERMIIENRAPYPVERTLLTSGMTLFAVESLFRGEVRLETPELNVAYSAPAQSTFWRS